MKNKKISKALNLYIPGNLCNFRCSYCYVSECLNDDEWRPPHFKYSLDKMVSAFSPERLGGIAYITVIGGGETLLPEEVVPLIKGLLKWGHIVEVVTNNTLNEKIEQLLKTPAEDIKRLIVKCSLHWLELKRLGKMEDYFENIRKIISAGASAYPFLVVCNDYMPYLDEISHRCMEEIGVLPQCTPCVVSNTTDEFFHADTVHTEPPCTEELIELINNKFDSVLFKECVKMLSINPRKLFCYAGKYSFVVSLEDGLLHKCHNVPTKFNFIEDDITQIKFEPVGCECGIASCSLQYQFYGCGCIPELSELKTYSEMIYRQGSINETIRSMMDIRLYEHDENYSHLEESKYLIKRINEKEQELQTLRAAIQQQYYEIKRKSNVCFQKTDKELVDELLKIVESLNQDSSGRYKIGYPHIEAMRKVCDNMSGGDKVFDKIFIDIFKTVLK